MAGAGREGAGLGTLTLVVGDLSLGFQLSLGAAAVLTPPVFTVALGSF
jgi:hypothetical protein